MPRKSQRPLDPRGREILFYKGDWESLAEFLAPRRIKPGTFVRAVIAKIVANRRAAVAAVQPSHVEIELEGLEDE